MNPHAPLLCNRADEKNHRQMVPIQIIAGLANDQTFFSKNPIEFQKKVKRVAHDMPRGHFNVWFFKTPLPFQIEFSRQKPGSIMCCCSGPTMVSQCSRTSKKVVIGLRTLRVVQNSTQYLITRLKSTIFEKKLKEFKGVLRSEDKKIKEWLTLATCIKNCIFTNFSFLEHHASEATRNNWHVCVYMQSIAAFF